jgi:hypothetical protein
MARCPLLADFVAEVDDRGAGYQARFLEAVYCDLAWFLDQAL